MGVSTGGIQAPAKDAFCPITAGRFVDGHPVCFVDLSKIAALDKFRHRFGTPKDENQAHETAPVCLSKIRAYLGLIDV